MTLHNLLGERCTDNRVICEQHGNGDSWHPTRPPDLVCFPTSTEEVVEIVRYARDQRLPVVPYGAGTSIEGQVNAIHGGICIDLSGMNQLLALNEADLDCRVQAGLTRIQLNSELRHSGLFFPIDPGADATLGGMTATRASGTNAVRYGTMRENVLGLRFVNADGKVVDTGTRARKSSAGYDLTRLMVGSEGTLGVITEIALRLHGLPQEIISAVANFPSVNDAVNTVIETIQMGIPVARIELLDRAMITVINQYNKLSLPERDTLFLEFHGSSRSVEEQVETFCALSMEHGGTGFQQAQFEEERTKLWAARHSAYHAILAAHPGTSAMTTDVCVPISELASVIGYVQTVLKNSPLNAELLGHVGDGNFHFAFCMRPGVQADLDEANRVNDLLVKRALEVGGTCTGEHGIGTGKLKFLELEHGSEAVRMMRAVKRAFDPDNLFNPGKTIGELR